MESNMIYTEWDKLKEVIVGSSYDINSLNQFNDTEFVDGMSKILNETEEDFQKLSNIFESFDVKVYRPKKLPLEKEQTRNWKSTFPYPAICPRDFHVVYGNTILSTIGGDCNRYTESDYFLEIMLKKYVEGRNYISMPKPLLSNNYLEYEKLEGQILYHAANIVKCGNVLIHTMPYRNNEHGRGTYAGLDWIKKNIGYDVKWAQIPRSGHADGKIALIKPGLLFCWDPSAIPEELKKWDYIKLERKSLPEYFNQIKIQHFYKDKVTNWLNHWIGYVDETVFDINVVSINENTLISNGYDKDVETKLKKYGVEMIPFDFRHKYFWDSGLHCVTLDLTREGEPNNYV
jgi:glycine amidinotransferase/scyllo-inosamine-4-phosphate amidinotransferase 1